MLYDVIENNDSLEIKSVSENEVYTVKKISVKSLIKTNVKEADINIAYLYEPFKSLSKKPVIIIHGMGERNIGHLSWFAKSYAEKGIPSLMPILPYNYERKSSSIKDGTKYFLGDMSETIADFRKAVIDIRQLMNVLVNLNISIGEFSILGFSFGGMISVITMGVDKRIKDGILVATGGNFLHIIWESMATGFIRKKYKSQSNFNIYGCTKIKCLEMHKNYKTYTDLLHSAEDIEKITPPKECYLFDPLTFAPLIKDRKVIIYRALFDEIFPKKSTVELWESLGKPEMKNLFSEHYSTIFYKRTILARSLELFGGMK